MKMEETQDNESEFDAFADDYDEALDQGLKLSGEGKDYFAEGRMKWLRSCLEESLPNPKHVLDFGCGTGSATPFFFKELPIDKLHGIDPSEKSLDRARDLWREYPAMFSTTDLEPKSNFDLAFCNGVFHHILPEERDDAVQLVFDHLKPGGWFAFWENNPWNPVTRLAMSRVAFDADAILVWPHGARRLLRSRGFEISKTNYIFFFPRFLRGLRRFEPLLRWIPLGGQYLVLCRKPE